MEETYIVIFFLNIAYNLHPFYSIFGNDVIHVYFIIHLS